MSDDNRRVLAFGRREQQVMVLKQQQHPHQDRRTAPFDTLASAGPPPPAPPAPSGPGRHSPLPANATQPDVRTVSMRAPQPSAPASASLSDARTMLMRAPQRPPGQAPMPASRAAAMPGSRPAPPSPSPAVPRSVAAPCRPSQPTPRVMSAPDARARQVHRRSEVVDLLRAEVARLRRQNGDER
jgi:hypothetical protein